MTVEELIAALDRHDWAYEYVDEYASYMVGQAERARIDTAILTMARERPDDLDRVVEGVRLLGSERGAQIARYVQAGAEKARKKG